MRRTAAFALTLLGLFDSLYLWWVYASPSHALVCLGTGCDVVRASRYSHLWGIPIPVFGVAFYFFLALLMFAEPLLVSAGAWIRRAIPVVAGAGFLCAAGLTALEAFVIHAWCFWCVVQAIAVTLVFVISLTPSAPYTDAAAALAAVRRYSLVLLLAVMVGAPGFRALMRSAELPPPPAPAMPAAQVAQTLVRPDSHATGNQQAPLTLVEFGDLQCPACAAAHPTMRELRRRFGDRVRFVFRQFPLERIHPYALHAAEAAECAAQQGKFWEAVDRLYQTEGDLKDASLERYARELGLDMDKFHACVADPATHARINRDIDDGHALGVRGTPTFFVGQQRIEGPLELSRFEKLLNQELARVGAPEHKSVISSGDAAQGAPAVGAQAASKSRDLASSKQAAASSGFGASGPLSFNTVQGSSTDCSEIAPTGPEPPMIHTAKAQELSRAGALFVDVRAPEDFGKSHIQRAVNLPFLEAERRATELPKDRTLVLYESGSGASAEVCAASRAVGRVLLSHGYKNVFVYQDGLAGWEKAQ